MIGAPTILDVSNDLLAASTELVRAPDVPDLPTELPLKQAPALAVPPTPDILAPAEAPAASEKITAGA